MKSAKTVLSTVVFGLALSVAAVGFAEPKGDAPGASPAKKPKAGNSKAGDGKPGDGKPGDGKPGDRGKPPKPDKNAPPGGPGHGPPGEHRGDHDGPRGDGKGDHRDHDGMGRPDHERGPGRHMRRAERIERLKELGEKEKEGKLSDEEKAQLDRLKKVQSRLDALKKKHAEHKSDRKKRRHEAKRKALKEFPGISKHPDAQKEYRKHARRMAHLQRARDVAEAEERTEMVTRIDELIGKENARHDKWLSQHRKRPNEDKGAKDEAAEDEDTEDEAAEDEAAEEAEDTKGEQP